MKMMNLCAKVIKRIHNEWLWARLDWKTTHKYYRQIASGKLLAELDSSTKINEADDFCDLAVVAFNNPKVIEYQIRTLRKFFRYPFRYTVFDNSNKDNISVNIKKICASYNIGYIRLPEQNFLPKGFGSYSHGIACNYLFDKYIKNGGGKYFGLLDHDIFLIEDFDISNHLEKQFFYGCKHRFYIWVGLWFMPMKRLIDCGVDFRPSLHLHGDTGARNGPIHFHDIDFNKYSLATDIHCLLDDSDTDIFRNGYSVIDNCWLHCWNASDYMGLDVNDKMQRIYALLEEKLSDNHENS